MQRLILAGLVLSLAGAGCGGETTGNSDGSLKEAGADGTIDMSMFDGKSPDTGSADGPSADSARIDGSPGKDSASKDILLSGDAAKFPKCTAVGGICTKHRWTICPVNTEPVQPNPHQDCAGMGGNGWCCVKAPASTCSAAAGANCVFGNKCAGCWGPASNTKLTCEAGRVCCEDICD